MGLSHTALAFVGLMLLILHMHVEGWGEFKDSKIYQSISMFQLNKQNTVKMVGGGGDKGPHKIPTTNNWSGIN